MTVPEHAHGTGWAGVNRYTAREEIRARMAERAIRIAALTAEQEVRHRAARRAAIVEELADLSAAQDADLALWKSLGLPEQGTLARHPFGPRSTYNGEDDHVAGDDY